MAHLPATPSIFSFDPNGPASPSLLTLLVSLIVIVLLITFGLSWGANQKAARIKPVDQNRIDDTHEQPATPPLW